MTRRTCKPRDDTVVCALTNVVDAVQAVHHGGDDGAWDLGMVERFMARRKFVNQNAKLAFAREQYADHIAKPWAPPDTATRSSRADTATNKEDWRLRGVAWRQYIHRLETERSGQDV
jgi:hypothetical protein